MMRLLGVLVGSALAVGALVVFVGIPEFTTEESVANNTVITLPMRPAPPPDARSDPPLEAIPEPAPAAEPITAAAADAGTDPDALIAAGTEIPDPGAQAEASPEPIVDAANNLQSPDESLQWYAFWSPFRSEIAASGFVDQLQRVTGLDYRVVKIKTGVYEVAFAYADDDEITSNLSQITAATGLQLPEG